MSTIRIWLPLAALALLAGAVLAQGLSAAKRAKPKTVLVSRQSAKQGGAGGNSTSYLPKVSANGRFVAFSSAATNLGGNPGFDNSFLYDRKRRRLTFVARANGPGRAAA
ncbi:MAG TPA: hypothetical protein VK919_08405, partial [Solirubrobacterales bacterium]|nr:hypothetical protein [Solirubrobacterales bacterium]